MKHVSESIVAYLGGELGPQAAAEVRAHLEDCAGCRGEFEQARKTWDLLEGATVDPSGAPTAWPRVRARTIAAGSGKAGWFFGRGPATRAGWAAAAVAAGVMLGALLPGGSQVDGNGAAALAADESTSWLEASWLDSTNNQNSLADQWLLAGLDEQENGS